MCENSIQFNIAIRAAVIVKKICVLYDYRTVDSRNAELASTTADSA